MTMTFSFHAIASVFVTRWLPLLLLVAALPVLHGCDLLGEDASDDGSGPSSASGNPCEGPGSYSYRLLSVDGDLPYRSVYIDSNNFSEVTAGRFTFNRTASGGGGGTWASSLTNRQVINGSQSVRDIERSGSYSCSGSIVNFQTGAEGTASIEGNRLIIESSVTYVFVRDGGGSGGDDDGGDDDGGDDDGGNDDDDEGGDDDDDEGGDDDDGGDEPTTGTIMVYSTYGAGGPISVRVGSRTGTLSRYFSGSGPSCPTHDPGATFVVEVSPGTHSIAAEAQNGVRWSRSLTVDAGECFSLELFFSGNRQELGEGDIRAVGADDTVEARRVTLIR